MKATDGWLPSGEFVATFNNGCPFLQAEPRALAAAFLDAGVLPGEVHWANGAAQVKFEELMWAVQTGAVTLNSMQDLELMVELLM